MTVSHLLYLHGFRSSPQSNKARQFAARVAQRHPSVIWWCPQLPPSPRAAMEMLLQGVQAWPKDAMAVVGSSLGGFYATHVAQRTGCKAVLLNPAIEPARDLAGQVGEHAAWHDPDQKFAFQREFIDELRALQSGPLTDLSRYYAVIAKGDEVLDWREMTARYAGGLIRLLEGSDHALSDFDDQIDEVFAFLDLRR